MLDQETKKKIDSARDILVGKVPDPKAQVEQITTALIYKFMDDMDKESEQLGGKARFFSGDFKDYAWSNLMNQQLSGNNRLNLYVEAITKMSQNPNIPQLFRNIFKDAFLPYRNPETLNLFVKEINSFSYDHSERLGDAFEYLLSSLSSQGDAGQFRTPRHIIEFIVQVVDPEKDCTILDPACGTAGFLISSYKHILSQNTKQKLGDKLTPDDKKKIMNHSVGYDISPDMVRISLVNMYLHGFPNPNIYEYDTLTSENRWDETYDVILANPPFMTPKGGIRPHKRFSLQSKRSEVLFADYIVEHLNPNGRAGVIVPDGIVNNKPNKKLRKLLLEYGLYCVVSLHNSVFKPYATAKTSILFFDKAFINKAKQLLFIRIDNDGYDLGDQRNKIDLDDLPEALKIIKEFKSSIKANSKFEVKKNSKKIVLVNINELTKNLSLFPNEYIALRNYNSNPSAYDSIGDLFNVEKGSLQSTKRIPGVYDFITASKTWSNHNAYTHHCEALLFAMGASGSLGRTHYINGKFIASDLCFILTPKKGVNINLSFYHWFFNGIRNQLVMDLAKGGAKLSINKTDFNNYKIFKIPIAVQEEIGKKIKSNVEKIDKLKGDILKLENDIEKEIQGLQNGV
jgi:type I restriction-modification system DNA methylase subunit